MQIKKGEISEWQFRDEVLSELLERYGFMNKNDYEVALFHLLLINKFKGKTDTEISMYLRVPESKVKRLRYEEALRYSADTDSQIAEYKKQLTEMLLGRKYRVHNDRVQFAISDKMLRLYLNDLLLKNARFADTSFNVNIVSMTVDDFLFLLSEINADSDVLIKKMKKDFEDATANLPKDIVESLVDLGKETALIVIKKTLTEGMADKLENFTKALCSETQDKIDHAIKEKYMKLKNKIIKS